MSSSSTSREEVRKFGLAGLVFFAVIAGVALWKDRQTALMIFGGLDAFMLLFIALPGPMAPVYRGWVFVAQKIGHVMNTIILSITFFLVITPMALLRRLMGKRPMALKPDPEASTYWVRRKVPAQSRRQFTKRY